MYENIYGSLKVQISLSAFSCAVTFWWIACGGRGCQEMLAELPVIRPNPPPVEL